MHFTIFATITEKYMYSHPLVIVTKLCLHARAVEVAQFLALSVFPGLQTGDKWASRILNPGKAREVTPPMSPSTQEIEETLGINVLPGEISIVAGNDNRKLGNPVCQSKKNKKIRSEHGVKGG
jgi:hypothetical protein